MGKILGIDYGTKRVGTSLSDEGCMFAFPHEVLGNDDELMENISKICIENDIKKIVLGKPEGFKGESGKIIKKIDNFKEAMEEEVALEVVFENEVLTTKQAERAVQGERARKPISNKKKQKKKTTKEKDASAAALILQSYLDKTRGQGLCSL